MIEVGESENRYTKLVEGQFTTANETFIVNTKEVCEQWLNFDEYLSLCIWKKKLDFRHAYSKLMPLFLNDFNSLQNK